MDEIYEALRGLRVPLQFDEYQLHESVMQELTRAGIPFEHEVKLASRCRIDLMCGSVGIELKRGKPEKGKLLEQLRRYTACDQLSGLILIAERNVDLPEKIGGKPVKMLCLNRLWGIAL